MSPAGYWPQLRAAVEAGADAVYFGLKHFSARAKVGFSLSELPEVMRTLHQRGVRGYVTFNTLVFEHELEEAAHAIAAIAETGVDALIVQDYGIVRLARRIVPELELHASTQMSITDSEGVRFAQSFGMQRVTLARELSLDEVRRIVAETGCELEIFVHGALCVAYSGQCFSSEAWGGRSANRGQCAQACRLPYEMLVDGRLEPLADARYLLSPGDLYALHQVPEIVASGVGALKIEGRYKDADYVALTTQAYRKAVDEAWAGLPLSVTREGELQLEQVYSRGLGAHFITGTNHQAVVEGRAPRHRGVRIGVVRQVQRSAVLIDPDAAHELAPLKPGDGLVFDAAWWRSPEEPEEGGRVYQALPGLDGMVELRFANGAIQFGRIRPGDIVWRTHDPDLDRVVKTYTEPAAPVSKQAVRVRARAAEGAVLETVWTLRDKPGVSVTVRSEAPLARAQNRRLSGDGLRDQFARLGNTPYELSDVEFECEGSVFAPASVLNQMRRAAVELLQQRQGEVAPVVIHDPAAALASVRTMTAAPAEEATSSLHLLVRTPGQLEAAIALCPASITLDYLDLYGLRPSVEQGKASGVEIRVAAPRVLKPGEARIVNFLVSLECPLLVRSTGMLQALRGQPHAPLIGDFSLNTANPLTAAAMLELGLDRLTPTHDLNADQVTHLARGIGAGKLEAVAYQHLPVFHTEHCVFCRFLSKGTTYKDCGRPCEEHRVALKDPSGRAHPVMADVGCRNTVFGAQAQEASLHLANWLDAGIRHFRLEFVHESGAEVRQVTRAFQSMLDGRITGEQLAAELKRIAPQGTTQGSLFVPDGYLTLPILQ
jgi:putative protease